MWEDGKIGPSSGGDESEEQQMVADVNDDPDKNARDDSQRMMRLVLLMIPLLRVRLFWRLGQVARIIDVSLT